MFSRITAQTSNFMINGIYLFNLTNYKTWICVYVFNIFLILKNI